MTRSMSQAEARRWLKRIREEVREADRAISSGDPDAVLAAMLDVSGAAAVLIEAAEDAMRAAADLTQT